MENMEMNAEMVEVKVVDVDAVLGNDSATVEEILEAKKEVIAMIDKDTPRALKGQGAARTRIRQASLKEDKLNLKLRKAITADKLAKKAAKATDSVESLF